MKKTEVYLLFIKQTEMKYGRSAHAFIQKCTDPNSKTDTPHRLSQPRPIRSPTLVVTSEVRKTPKEIKNNKAHGIENLTSDVMIIGGEESVKQITTKNNQVIETRNIPIEWKDAKMMIVLTEGDIKDII